MGAQQIPVGGGAVAPLPGAEVGPPGATQPQVKVQQQSNDGESVSSGPEDQLRQVMERVRGVEREYITAAGVRARAIMEEFHQLGSREVALRKQIKTEADERKKAELAAIFGPAKPQEECKQQ